MAFSTDYKLGDSGHIDLTNNMAIQLNRTLWVDDYASIQAAIDAASAGDTINFTNTARTITTQINVNKAVTLNLRGTITAPESDYAFYITASDARILGKATIVMNGGTGAIKIANSHRVNIKDLSIDLNSQAAAIGIGHYGGWYVDIENIFIQKSKSAADSIGLYIKNVNTGEGDGSLGVYVSRYTNITCLVVKIEGADPNTVTTCTFTNLDCSNFYASLARAITLITPVIQQTGGTSITLRSTHGFTAVGGDYEGTGIIYDIDSPSQGIMSLNNLYSGFTGTYLEGGPGAGGVFNDYSENVNSDLLKIKETTTPTADSGYAKVYSKSDNKLYFQDGDGTEHEISLVA